MSYAHAPRMSGPVRKISRLVECGGFDIDGNPWASSLQDYDDGLYDSVFFFCPLDLRDSIERLQAVPLGCYLLNHATNAGIDLCENDPENSLLERGAIALYRYTVGSVFTPGEVVHDHRRVTAPVLGHEFRHAWQHVNGIMDMKTASPEEAVLLSRFIEADARAVGFAVAVECIAAEKNKNMAKASIVMLDPDEKEVCHYSDARLAHLASDRGALKQAMRRIFDSWIASAPRAASYETEIAETLMRVASKKSVLQRIFSSSSQDSFTTRGVSGEFLSELVQKIGALGAAEDGNYLLDTQGLSFDHSFYTAIDSYPIQKIADRVAPRLTR